MVVLGGGGCTALVLLPPLAWGPCCVQAGVGPLNDQPCSPPSALGPLELANALAACCLSSRLSSQHRQWAAQQLVRTLAAHDRDNQGSPQTLADVGGDLRKCSSIKLEAHQNRVMSPPPTHTHTASPEGPWVSPDAHLS